MTEDYQDYQTLYHLTPITPTPPPSQIDLADHMRRREEARRLMAEAFKRNREHPD